MDNSEKKQSDRFNQSLANELAREFLIEQRRGRRWGIFFKSLLALYLFGLLFFYIGQDLEMGGFSKGKHSALIDINGMIAANREARADFVVTGLRSAFEDENTEGVILRINSPGGSAVQAGYINDEINRLREKHPDIPVYAVIGDICASGGYYIAAAADEIYANKASLVGSIGVVMAGFGFADALDKLGVERRLLHAGENKGFMDPFQPLKDTDQAHAQTLLDEIHGQFIEVVKQGRGDRLTGADETLFSGLIWSGRESVELGLVDGLASASQVARDIIGAADIVDFTRREDYLGRFARNMGLAFFRSLDSGFELR